MEDYEAKGIKAKGYLCDVTREEQVQEMIRTLLKISQNSTIIYNISSYFFLYAIKSYYSNPIKE